MPRQARLDAPGAVHHVMARGIERRLIVHDDRDRDQFLDCVGGVLARTQTPCYAWALMSNHFHLLLATGKRPLARVLHAALTRYAGYFNRRHRRSGHVFQNRYKSILCERDPYFLELVRYIHLNPVRVSLVRDLRQLGRYPWTGHAGLLGVRPMPWQDFDAVLEHFGARVGPARRAYAAFVREGWRQGRRPELTGGGLVRSAGGWRALAEQRRAGVRVRGDERILGSGEFVEDALRAAAEQQTGRRAARRAGWTPARVVATAAASHEVSAEALASGRRGRALARARAMACWWLTEDLGLTATAAARHVGVSQPAVSQHVTRLRESGPTPPPLVITQD